MNSSMLNLGISAIENILQQLEVQGHPFARYVLHKIDGEPQILGRGGFSVVYSMVNLSMPSKQYALKVIGLERQVVKSEKFWETVRLQSFLCEQSPYVMQIMNAREFYITLDEHQGLQDVIELEDYQGEGHLIQFILLECLERIIVTDKFQQTMLVKDQLGNELEVLRLAIQIGQGMLVSHNYNILHRDIKLENIFWDEQEKCYKLGDYGIAKYVEGGNAETVVYSAGYGAPEIEGRLSDFYNATADIYSFGIVLYLLLNELEFPGSRRYVANLIQYDPTYIFPAPKNASVGMTRMIRKMCSYYAEDRYQSMEEVLAECNGFMQEVTLPEEVDDIEPADLLTQTHYESELLPDHRKRKREKLFGRFRRKKLQKEYVMDYKESIGFHSVATMLILFVALASMGLELTIIEQRHVFVLAILVFLEGVLLGQGELRIIFPILLLGSMSYSILTAGLMVPHIILGLCMVTRNKTYMKACAIAVGSRAVVESIGWLESMAWIQSKYILGGSLFLLVLFYIYYWIITMDLVERMEGLQLEDQEQDQG